MSNKTASTSPYDQTVFSLYKVLVNAFLYPRGIRDFVFRTVEVRNGDRVLDAGCGYGILDKAIGAKVEKDGRTGVTQHAFDLSAVMLRGFEDADGAGIRPVQSDVRALPYRDGSFDLVVTSAMLEYVPDLAEALTALRKVLKPGGRIVLFISRKSPLNTLLFLPFGRPRCYRFSEIERSLLASGFNDIRKHRFPPSSFALSLWGMILEATT